MAEVPAGTPPAVAPYVRALGVDLTVEVLLEFGGAEIYFSPTSNGRSKLAKLVGAERAAELTQTLQAGTRGHRRVPTARRWIAFRLRDRGLPIAEIARRLHVTDVGLRKWFEADEPSGNPRTTDPRQLPLI